MKITAITAKETKWQYLYWNESILHTLYREKSKNLLVKSIEKSYCNQLWLIKLTVKYYENNVCSINCNETINFDLFQLDNDDRSLEIV